MTIVGITGGIGSGKSVVARMFTQLGIPVYDADRAARMLYDKNPDLLRKVIDEFGEAVLDAKGRIDRKKLGAIVFHHDASLKKLNRMVHPLVKKDFKEWLTLHRSAPYVLKEAAILFESGTDKDCDTVITVVAPQELRIQRVKERDQRSLNEIRMVMDRQSTDEEKASQSAYVVRNGEHDQVLPQVLAIHEELLKSVKLKMNTAT
jgi:dephospho-CoA kinase